MSPVQGPFWFLTQILVTTLCVSDNANLVSLTARANERMHQAFRPKTCQAYCSMFRIFLAFCIVNKVSMMNVSVKVLLAFLECLVYNKCSACVIANYIFAIRANLVLYELPFLVLDHPRIKYFLKLVRINRPWWLNHITS